MEIKDIMIIVAIVIGVSMFRYWLEKKQEDKKISSQTDKAKGG